MKYFDGAYFDRGLRGIREVLFGEQCVVRRGLEHLRHDLLRVNAFAELSVLLASTKKSLGVQFVSVTSSQLQVSFTRTDMPGVNVTNGTFDDI